MLHDEVRRFQLLYALALRPYLVGRRLLEDATQIDNHVKAALLGRRQLHLHQRRAHAICHLAAPRHRARVRLHRYRRRARLRVKDMGENRDLIRRALHEI